MERTLEKGEDQIQKICDTLKNETLEPAKIEAKKIIADADVKAEEIIQHAHKAAENHILEARLEIEKLKNIFTSSLGVAGKQALEGLRQMIENKFFDDELQALVCEESADPKIIAKMIEGIINAVEKEGLSADISAVIPYCVLPHEVNRCLGSRILKKIRNESVTIGDFAGGARVTLHDKKITLDMTDKTLVEFLSNYLRKDFREFLFQ